MTPTHSSDSPPPRPAHIWSVEENIAYFRRCAPDSIYNLAQLQSSVVEPKRPSSRSSSVHSSEKESDGAGSDDDNDDDDEPLNASESTENTDASPPDWKDSIATGKYADTLLKTPQPGANDTTVFCMRFPSSATTNPTKEAATGTRQSDIPSPSADTSPNRLARAGSTHAARESLTGPTRDSEQPLATGPLNPEPSTNIPPAPTLPQEPSPLSSPPARVCEWCCRPALPATDVCIIHKLAEIEEARRDWAITGYKKFREDQLTKATSERIHLEKALREKMREQQNNQQQQQQQQQQRRTSDNNRECQSKSLDAEIRDMQTELRTRDEQIKKWSTEKEQEQKMLWTRLPVPSRKTIVRAHHGKIRVFSGRDPVGGAGLVRKRCGCKEEYLRLSIQQGYV